MSEYFAPASLESGESNIKQLPQIREICTDSALLSIMEDIIVMGLMASI